MQHPDWIPPQSPEWHENLAKETGVYKYPWKSEFDEPRAEAIFADRIAEYLSKDARVLDVGCGHGEFTKLFIGQAKELIGIDIVEGYIATAREGADSSVSFLVLDADKPLPFADDYFCARNVRKTADRCDSIDLEGGLAMDWLDRMNRAMDYIEDNLADEISYDELAKIACCSTYHFQRMFPFITGISLSEYIRRRRLTVAAFELQTTDAKVIDVALKYGYQSPEAFARAFKNLHGIMPMAARDKGVSLKAYPRMSFHISIRGEVEMNYRIEDKSAFEMFGVYGEISQDMEKAFVEVPRFRQQCDEDGSVDLINFFAGIS